MIKKIGFWKWLALKSVSTIKNTPNTLRDIYGVLKAVPEIEIFVSLVGLFMFGSISTLEVILHRANLILLSIPIISILIALHGYYRIDIRKGNNNGSDE